MCNCWQGLFINFLYKAETVVDTRNESETASETSSSVSNPVVQQISSENNDEPVFWTPDLDKELCHNLNLHIFTFNQLKLATRNFCPNSSLGQGGFGTVYKGWINEIGPDGTKTITVAVKALNHEGSQGHREWLAEVNMLGQLHHPHLVKLIGYSCEDNHRLLVYEFMPFGSLEDHLFSKTSVPLSWTIRIKIALGAAKGLAFLHGAKKPVIYRDFKASNILIDSDYIAKISDFGLAKDGPDVGQTHVTTRVLGTYGYAAPEYVMTGHLTPSSDVYSFGVVLLELLTGRKAFDKKRPRAEQNLVEWARPYLRDKKKLLRIIDPRLDGVYSVKGVQKAAFLALHCLSQHPKMRPLMTHVVEALESVQNTGDVFYTYIPSAGMAKDGQQKLQ